MKGCRIYPKYSDYIKNVVEKCSHKYVILERNDFKQFAIFKLIDVDEVMPAGILFKIVPAKCKSYTCAICGMKKVFDLVERLKTVDMKGYRFFTLTLRNEYSNENTEKNLKRISDCFNKLNNNLRKLPEFKGLEYFKVIEVGNDGMVHIHGIWNKFVDTKRLGVMWYSITGDSFKVELSRIRSKNDAVKYLYKYLTKACNTKFALNDSDLFGLDLINTAQLFYENNKRRYSSSRNFFSKVIKITNTGDKDFTRYGFENQKANEIELELKSLIRLYDLKKENFDFPFYNETDSFLQNLF